MQCQQSPFVNLRNLHKRLQSLNPRHASPIALYQREFHQIAQFLEVTRPRGARDADVGERAFVHQVERGTDDGGVERDKSRLIVCERVDER